MLRKLYDEHNKSDFQHKKCNENLKARFFGQSYNIQVK